MNRLQHKNSMLVKLGVLIGPLQRLIQHPNQYNEQERAETLARYFAEYHSVQEECRSFCKGQPGHDYAIEFDKFFYALHAIAQGLIAGKRLEDILDQQTAIAQAAIDAVPIPQTSIILEAGSPFTAYCRLQQLCEVDATASIIWLDPFMGASIFHRYVSSLRKMVPVTLVTSEPSQNAGNQDKTRWTEFLDISRLYAQEHGPTLYRLIVQQKLHDRWVVFDEKRIYALGGSAKDAGNKDYFTISSVEASNANLQNIRTHIDSGIECFGPNTLTHR